MGYRENFIDAIMANSVADEYEAAIQEWTWRGEQILLEDGEVDKCCCKHDIQDVRIVHNDYNKRKLNIGNCCIHKFGVEREHYNKSRLAYLKLGLQLVDNVREEHYLNNSTLPRIERGEQFNLKDVKLLERITGKECRFRLNISEYDYTLLGIRAAKSPGYRDYFIYELLPLVSSGKKLKYKDTLYLRKVTGLEL